MTSSTRKLPDLSKAKWLNEPRLQSLLAILNRGGETRIAGGAVRNALLGMPIADVDLATTFVPQDVTQMAKGAGFGVHPTGIDHGTVTVVARGATFEVTTLRRDVETDGRHAHVAFTNNFAEDASRRDFTINALYLDRKGKIYDFTDGYTDILKRRVRFVGEATQRITEDYLRILRFFRFFAAYAKGAPDRAGLAACKKHKAGLDGLSAERIRQELFKLLAAPRAAEALEIMAKAGILKHIVPYTDQWRVIKRLSPDPVLRLFAIASAPSTLKEKLRLSNDEAQRIEGLMASPELKSDFTAKEARAKLYEMGVQAWRDAVQLSWAKGRAGKADKAWSKLLKLPDDWPVPSLPISGKDLLAKGFGPGPDLGQVLKQAEAHWVASDFKATRDELLNFVESQKV
ncbi:CCA tRNA nucleotidyltransferase [Aestuariivirga litoralis]|uniref:CCA tRNA nucleotidyltransferase n=1 Tax=Aestuariivirga litoralis TaxID=2650924 RepID=UPI0018C61C78|nr:CCA tRNA nucleotidyltransferase [Aestuariivirga litoralis]MBG1230954.1 CCA tRNA nucleotidyltransferase [Aestuariivirga litoralis]